MPWNLVPIKLDDIGAKCVCPHCDQTFARKFALDRHLKKQTCTKPTKQQVSELAESTNATMVSMRSELNELKEQYAQLAAAQLATAQLTASQMVPAVNNQNLNILCLGSKDNLLDILSSADGLPHALSYLKGCALARLSGDCRILERVYKLDTTQAALMYANKSKTKFVYYDERQRRMVETNKEVMAKKLADILQRSYLKGMGSFRTDLLDNQRDDYDEMSDQMQLPELDPYDLQIWNAHIHELADENYQKKVLKNLKIPTEPFRE